MAKIALLIGVSEYEPGLNPLPSAVKDVKAVERILRHPDLCEFAESEIRVLENPDRQAMAEAIEAVFANRQKDDLVLLFFSGHGVKDDQGKLYLTGCKTRRNTQGEFVRSTAVPAHFIQESMSRSRSKRQIVILDCCFSGAFAEGLSAKDNGSVDVKAQLGGEGRVVLTSSTSTQYSFEQRGSDLSIYTRYLVEGIETGAADQDNSGTISVYELHEYAKRKVQETAPAMQPEIYAVKEGFKILIAKASTVDPKLKYRKEVEQFASRGEISEVARKGLEARRIKLGLLLEEAATIEAEVVKPYRDYKQRLQQYEREFHQLVQKQYPLSAETRNDLTYFQQALGLREEDTTPIERHLIKQQEPEQGDPFQSNQPFAPPRWVAPFAAKSQRAFLPLLEELPFAALLQRSLKQKPSFQTIFSSTQPRSLTVVTGFCLALTAFCAASYSYTQMQKGGQVLEQAKAKQAQQNYQDCLALASSVRSLFMVGMEADRLWRDCSKAQALATEQANQWLQQARTVLQQANDLAANGEPGEAIARLQQIPLDSPLQTEVQQFANRCLEQLRQMLQTALAEGNWDSANAMVAKIPPGSPAYRDAQEQMQQWRLEDDRNRQHWQLAQQALSHGDGAAALQAAGQITAQLSWSQPKATVIAAAQQLQLQVLAQQQAAAKEQEYAQVWQAAQQHLKQREADNAIAAANNLPDSALWQERKQKVMASASTLKQRQAACHLFSLGLGNCAQ